MKKAKPKMAMASQQKEGAPSPSNKSAAAAGAGIQSPKFGAAACCLVSRNDYPCDVTYDGETMVLSPRQGAKHPCVIADASKLKMPLPAGVFKIPLPAHLKA